MSKDIKMQRAGSPGLEAKTPVISEMNIEIRSEHYSIRFLC